LLALAARTMSTSHSFGRLDGPHGALTHGGLTAAALVVGALIGASLSCISVPGELSYVVLLTALVAAALGVALAAARASLGQSAAVGAVVGFALLTVAPVTAARLVAFAERRARVGGAADRTDEDPVEAAVRRAATVLVGWSAALAAALGTALVPAAASRSGYCAAAAGCVSLALLLRAGAARLTSEVVPLLLAGAVGVFTLLAVGPGHLGWPGWISSAGTVLIGTLLIVYSLRRLLRPPNRPATSQPSWMSGLGSTLGGTGAALAIAALGAFGWFVHLGRHL